MTLRSISAALPELQQRLAGPEGKTEPLHWFPLCPADMLQRMQSMGLEQVGAYFLLLMAMWHEGPLADDNDRLAKIVRMTSKRWRRLRPQMQPYFDVSNDLWACGWLEDERREARKKHAKASARGQKGAEARWRVRGL